MAHQLVFDLPDDILVRILVFTEKITTVSLFARTCRKARAIVYSGKSSDIIWKQYYLCCFNDPESVALERRDVGIPFRAQDLPIARQYDGTPSSRLPWIHQLIPRVKILKVLGAPVSAQILLDTKIETLMTVLNTLSNLRVAHTTQRDLDLEYLQRALIPSPPTLDPGSFARTERP
ncbi:hypothetical protein CC2G_000026 [Coprinopsis cinerea AmutBmut pab1-1]|nr:hypothetical protein CC2G_000026 [Coprinopsis cinerea AmutBmut pab1-1]